MIGAGYQVEGKSPIDLMARQASCGQHITLSGPERHSSLLSMVPVLVC
jgi:phosphotransferase system HPr-like phosphotransfer protein